MTRITKALYDLVVLLVTRHAKTTMKYKDVIVWHCGRLVEEGREDLAIEFLEKLQEAFHRTDVL
jgi:hypothetical protein